MVTRTPGEELKTMGLGSCVAVIVYDVMTKTVGMMHIVLPDSSRLQKKAEESPGYFADTGIPLLLAEMKKKGVNPFNIKVKLAGGANVVGSTSSFNIGKRNVMAVRKALWQAGLGPVAEDTGGSVSRTVTISTDTLEVNIKDTVGNWSVL